MSFKIKIYFDTLSNTITRNTIFYDTIKLTGEWILAQFNLLISSQMCEDGRNDKNLYLTNTHFIKPYWSQVNL